VGALCAMISLVLAEFYKMFPKSLIISLGLKFFTLVLFGAVAAEAKLLLAGPDKAATADAVFVMELIPVRSMSSSPDFLSALLLAERVP
jgi:hypothetical protein